MRETAEDLFEGTCGACDHYRPNTAYLTHGRTCQCPDPACQERTKPKGYFDGLNCHYFTRKEGG